MKKLFLGTVTFLALAAPAIAQQAPAPRPAPRTPVNREALAGHFVSPSVRDVQGQATIIDGDKLRIGDVDMRLFGVVPPQLAASFGPQARAAFDAVTAGQIVSCHIRDRDHDGRYLATCRTANGADPALELLRRGLAVTARGSLVSTEFAPPYLAAEEAAQAQKIGLWSVSVPQPAPLQTPSTPPVMDAAKALAATATPSPASAPALVPPASPPVVIDVKKDDKVVAPKPPALTDGTKTSPLAIPASQLEADEDNLPISAQIGFFARYQILIAGFLMLSTALSIIGALARHRWVERREEMKAVAAALRGELMAARAVCQTRLKGLVSEEDDKAMVWPRLRSTLYQAYVGRLGWLGASLARQVASIYGQSSDYAAYYNSVDAGKTTTTPKKQALLTLINHIEEVLPRLATIEQTGTLSFRKTPPAIPPSPGGVPVMAPAPHVTNGDVERVGGEPFETSSNVTSAVTSARSPATQNVQATAPASVSQRASPAPSMVQTLAETVMSSPAALLDVMRRFARERFKEPAGHAHEDPMADYAALIEEEMANLSFGEDDMEETTSFNLPEKKRGTGA